MYKATRIQVGVGYMSKGNPSLIELKKAVSIVGAVRVRRHDGPAHHLL